MSISRTHRLWLMLFLAAGGVYLAWRAIDRAGPATPWEQTAELSNAVRQMLAFDQFEAAPTANSLPALTERAGSVAARKIDAIAGATALPPDRAEDLAAAFSQRFAAVVGADFDAATAGLEARGYRNPGRDRTAWMQSAEFTRFVPVALEQMEVRVIYEHGRHVATPDIHQGFGVTTTAPAPPATLPLPEDPVSGQLDVVEIRVPVRKKTLQSKETTSLIGLQFAWSLQRRQWVPWRNVIYKSPDEVHAALPF